MLIFIKIIKILNKILHFRWRFIPPLPKKIRIIDPEVFFSKMNFVRGGVNLHRKCNTAFFMESKFTENIPPVCEPKISNFEENSKNLKQISEDIQEKSNENKNCEIMPLQEKQQNNQEVLKNSKKRKSSNTKISLEMNKKIQTEENHNRNSEKIIEIPQIIKANIIPDKNDLLENMKKNGISSENSSANKKIKIIKKMLTPVRSCAEPTHSEMTAAPKSEAGSLSKNLKEETKSANKSTCKNETILTEQLEVESVVDPDYKQRKNFAILKLTEGSAKRCSSSFIATPIQPYSIENEKKEEASKDAMELLEKGYILVANTANIRRTLELYQNSPLQ